MDARLRRRPTRWEALVLALAFGIVAVLLCLDSSLETILAFDYKCYTETAHGNLAQFRYAEWILPLFWLWAKLPPVVGFALWSAVNILSLFFAARIFDGSTVRTLLTFQFFSALFLGQIDGLLVGGLALGWWAMAHKKWALAGFGFWLAATKFQLGLPIGFLLWLAAETDWNSRLRVLVLPFLLTLASLLIHPGWPIDLVERNHAVPPYDVGSISLWRTIGPAALLFLLPPLLLPLEKRRRLLALAAAVPLVLPYFQGAGLLVLFVFPVGWVPPMLGNLGYLSFLSFWPILHFLWVIPLIIYISALRS